MAPPLLCLSLTGRTLAEDLAAIERYRGRVDLVELRADLLDPAEALRVRSFPELAGLPCILTIRRKAEGGGYEEGEGVRLVMIAKALIYARPDAAANFAYIDLERDFRVPAIEEACRAFGTRIIRSRYDLSGMPADLDAALAELSCERDEIPKLVVSPRDAAELSRLLSWARGLPPSERIIVGTGDFGVPSRILAGSFGSAVAYAGPLGAGLPAAAPGQLDPAVMEDAYRFRAIGPGTKIFAIGGGRPVIGSKIPYLHNAAFGAAGIDAVLVPIPAEDPVSLMAALDSVGARGAAITVPLKQAIIPFLASKSAEVEDIGACNTVVRSEEGWVGYNTDAPALERSILEFLGRESLNGVRATLIGAGGGAKTAAWVLAKLGAAVLVLHRNPAKSKSLARRYAFAWGPCDDRAEELMADHSDLVIQATPVGMEGGVPGDPLDWYDFTGREAVLDLVYRPERTALLARAAEAGCRIRNGWSMLQYQGAAQFRLWVGSEPPSGCYERG